jgi:hypothetical protein
MEMEKNYQLKSLQAWQQTKHFILIPVDAISSKGYDTHTLELYSFFYAKHIYCPSNKGILNTKKSSEIILSVIPVLVLKGERRN